ncbi:hypothetical protein V1511DRAFT_224507 [Dipodascopsis uninucleata]
MNWQTSTPPQPLRTQYTQQPASLMMSTVSSATQPSKSPYFSYASTAPASLTCGAFTIWKSVYSDLARYVGFSVINPSREGSGLDESSPDVNPSEQTMTSESVQSALTSPVSSARTGSVNRVVTSATFRGWWNSMFHQKASKRPALSDIRQMRPATSAVEHRPFWMMTTRRSSTSSFSISSSNSSDIDSLELRDLYYMPVNHADAEYSGRRSEMKPSVRFSNLRTFTSEDQAQSTTMLSVLASTSTSSLSSSPYGYNRSPTAVTSTDSQPKLVTRERYQDKNFSSVKAESKSCSKEDANVMFAKYKSNIPKIGDTLESDVTDVVRLNYTSEDETAKENENDEDIDVSSTSFSTVDLVHEHSHHTGIDTQAGATSKATYIVPKWRSLLAL